MTLLVTHIVAQRVIHSAGRCGYIEGERSNIIWRCRMGKSVIRVFCGVLLTMALCGIALASTATQTGQASDPVAVVTAFNAAVSAQDLTGALALLAPDFRYVSGPGSAIPTDQKKGEFPGKAPFQQVNQSNIHVI